MSFGPVFYKKGRFHKPESRSIEMDKMIKIGVIGRSPITMQFVGGCLLDGHFQVTAVYSRDQENGQAFARKLAERAGYGADQIPLVFTEIEELASSDVIEAIYIASPNLCHEEQTEVFLNHGKHVICEKPITVSEEGYQRLHRLAKEKKLIYMEAITSVHSPTRELVLEGMKEIGPVVLARINYCQHSSKYGKYLDGENPNIFNMDLYTGALNDIGVYAVYGAVDLFGMPGDILASTSFLTDLSGQKKAEDRSDAEIHENKQYPADTAGSALFVYDHFTAIVSYSKVGQSMIGSEIIGERGTLQIGLDSQYLDVKLMRTAQQVQMAEKYPGSSVIREMARKAAKEGCNENSGGPSASANTQYDTAFSLRLAGFLPKEEVMSKEASDFYRYITDPSSAYEYDEVCKKSEWVQHCMDMIKMRTGIRYSE